MKSAKLATPNILKIKLFKNKSHDVIALDYEVTNKILSHGSNYVVEVVMQIKFGNSNISMREVIMTSIL